MKTLIFLTLLLAIPAIQASAKKVSRDDLLDRIEYACNVRVKEDQKNHRDVCACVTRNFDAKLNFEDLELLARSHEEQKAAEEELQKETHNDLILFDYEVTESCLENPKWDHGK
jgi:hypothetical protein